MIKENKLFGYIYCAISPSDKKYYGKTISTIESRKYGHRKGSINGKNIFSCVIRKYGFDNFIWTQKEEFCVDLTNDLCLDKIELNEILSEREKYWIEKDKTHLREFGYNATLGGDGVVGYIYTEEQCKKRSEQLKGEKNGMYNKSNYNNWLQKFGKEEADRRKLKRHNKISKRVAGEGNPNYDRKAMTDETIKKISKSRKNTIASPETRKNMSIAQNKRYLDENERNKSSQVGEQNGMYRTCAYNIWIQKFGKEEADRRKEETNIKRKQTWELKRKTNDRT